MDAAVLDALEIGCYDLGCFDTHSVLDAAVLDSTVLDGTILDVVNTPYEGDFGCFLEVMNVGCCGFGCCVNWMLRSWMLQYSPDLWYHTCWWCHSIGNCCRIREGERGWLVTPLRGVGPLTFTLTFDTWPFRVTRVAQMDSARPPPFRHLPPSPSLPSCSLHPSLPSVRPSAGHPPLSSRPLSK